MIKIVGIMPVRNEDWVLGLSARVALAWCDELYVLLHDCTDRSKEIALGIATEYNPRVTIVEDDKPDWDEMRHRQALLEMARCQDPATHIAIVDSDEVVTGDLLGLGAIGAREKPINSPLRNMVSFLRSPGPTQQGQILQIPLYNVRGGIENYHATGVWSNRIVSVAFPDHPSLMWAGDRFHHREPMGRALQAYRPLAQGKGGVIHLWGASERRLKAKHALYKLTERLRWPDKPMKEIDETYSLAIHGRPGDTPSTWKFSPVCDSWLQPYARLLPCLDIDATPWQEAECRRLIAEHGAERFAGFDLFGVV